jgi:hypothetical protein
VDYEIILIVLDRWASRAINDLQFSSYKGQSSLAFQPPTTTATRRNQNPLHLIWYPCRDLAATKALHLWFGPARHPRAQELEEWFDSEKSSARQTGSFFENPEARFPAANAN